MGFAILYRNFDSRAWEITKNLSAIPGILVYEFVLNPTSKIAGKKYRHPLKACCMTADIATKRSFLKILNLNRVRCGR